MPDPTYLPVIDRSVLFDERERVFLPGRLPFELDGAHRMFFDGVLAGGRSVAELLEELPEDSLENWDRPSSAELTELLADADSYVAPIPFEAEPRYDAIVVDFTKGADGPARKQLTEALSRRSRDESVLLFSARPWANPPAGVDVRAFRERRSAPEGHLHGFIQLVRSALLRLEPARLLLIGPEAAAFCSEACTRHYTTLIVGQPLTPFLRTARSTRRARRNALQVHLDLLYWLRSAKPDVVLSSVLAEVRAASEALGLALANVDTVLETAPGLALRRFEPVDPTHPEHVPRRIESACTETLSAALFALKPTPARASSH